MAETTTVTTPPTERAPRSTLVNGVIGGIVAIVLAFLPFSTLLGGGVAGYLQGGEYREGAKAGAIAGVVAFLPAALAIGILAFFIPVGVGMGGLPMEVAGAGVLFFLFVLAVVLAYTVGFAALGGVLGVYLKNEL